MCICHMNKDYLFTYLLTYPTHHDNNNRQTDELLPAAKAAAAAETGAGCTSETLGMTDDE